MHALHQSHQNTANKQNQKGNSTVHIAAHILEEHIGIIVYRYKLWQSTNTIAYYGTKRMACV